MEPIHPMTGNRPSHNAATSGEDGRRVFIAGPFKSLVDPATGVMAPAHRRRFERLIEFFENRGYRVHNAHQREGWGAEFMSPEACTRLDYDEIAAADLVVALPGSPASPGTHIELGWASALGKPILLLLEPEAEYAFLVRGLHTVTKVSFVTLQGESGHLEELASMVPALLGAGAPP